MMLTRNNIKTMAKSLRVALGNRNVPLSHSECLEIVAQQFGLADWNTLVAKIPEEEAGSSKLRDTETVAPTKPSDSPQWGPCSFCGKSAPDVQILLGGCGGWEGFRKRRNPESGERSNAFLCNECVALVARIEKAGVGASAEPQTS